MKQLALCTFFILFIGQAKVFSQEKEINFGIGFKAGFSRSSQSKDFTNTSIGLYTPLSSGSIVGFMVWNFKKEDSKPFIFKGLRTSFAYSSRGGIYDVDGMTKRVSFSYIDVDIMLPVSFQVSESLKFYLGMGGVASFVIAKTDETPNSNPFHPGGFIEMGISTQHGSYFAVQILGTYSDYSIQNLALTFGLTLGDIKNSKP